MASLIMKKELVGLMFLLLASYASSAQPCSMLVIKSQEVCTMVANTTIGCCNVWCEPANCPKTTYYMSCVVKYVQTSKCCEGHGGDDCKPVCSRGCSVNGECSSPDTCTCMDGWTGESCEQVSGLEVYDIFTTSLSLSWDVPTNTSNINGYYIYLENDNHMVNTTTYDIINETTIDGLEPYSSYRACIVPLVLTGNGTENCVDVQTAEGVPTSPPLDISVSSIISTAVLVCWTPPTQPNGIITHYTLRIDYNGAIATETVGGIHSLYFIDQLSPDQLVGVSMSAATVSGSGPWSSFVFNQTGDVQSTPEISSVVTDGVATVTPSSSPDNDDIFLLSWTPPLSLAPPTEGTCGSFYLLSISKLTAANKYQWALRLTQNFSSTLTLERNIPYQLEVFIGNATTSEYSLSINRTFFAKEGVPTAHPSNITAARSTEDSITVTWHPLTLIKARGFVTHYTVRYAKAVNSCDYTYDSNETITQDSNIVLNAVAIDSVYCVSVSAVTVGGNGPLSTPPVMVPLYQHRPLSLNVQGGISCENWLSNNSCSESKIRDFRRQLITVLNRNCSCINSESYFVNEQFKCESSERNRINYTASIVGTQSMSSSQLVTILEEWSDSRPEITIQGQQLFVSTEEVTDSPTNCDSSDQYIIAVIVLAVSLLLALIGWLGSCLFFMKFRHNTKIGYRQTVVDMEDLEKKPSQSGT